MLRAREKWELGQLKCVFLAGIGLMPVYCSGAHRSLLSFNSMLTCRNTKEPYPLNKSGYVFVRNGNTFYGIQRKVAIHSNWRDIREPQRITARGTRIPRVSYSLSRIKSRYKHDNFRDELPDELHELLRLLLSRHRIGLLDGAENDFARAVEQFEPVIGGHEAARDDLVAIRFGRCAC